jgi:tripartite-type tricarboxylate transporter receptor subunit TctC
MRSWYTCAAIAGAILWFCGFPALAQTSSFPSRPVRMIVGFPPGAGNDLIARAVSQHLSEIWKQPVVVENRAGASGSIGAEAVARAPADGHTLLLAGSSHLIHAALSSKVPYHAVNDFTPIATVGTGQLVLEVNLALPVKTLKELIDLAKAQPGKLSYGSAGTGTSLHIAGEMFKRMAGVDMVHIPYRGSAPAQNDLIGGQVQLMFQVTQSALPSVAANQVRAIAVTGKTRLAELPNVPTVDESGIPGYEMSIWWGVLGPAGLPKDLVQTLQVAVQRAIGDAETRKRLVAIGLDPSTSSHEEFLQVMRADLDRFATLIRDAGIKGEE